MGESCEKKIGGKSRLEMPLVVFGVFSVVFGALLLAGLTELPLFVAVLLMVPGCIAELHGWGLLYELDKRSQENRPAYYAFLDLTKSGIFPFMYFFVILIILLM